MKTPTIAALLLALAPGPAFGQVTAPRTARDVRHAGDALVYLLYANPSGELDFAAVDEFGVVQALRQFVNAQTSTFPLATSSAGFSYTFDSELQIQVLNSKSFGPLFAERPLTGGRGKWSVNLNFQRTDWQSIDGLDFREGLLFTQINPPRGSPTNVRERVWRSAFELTTTTTVVGFSYGLTDRLDLSASVPFVAARVAGQASLLGTDYNGTLVEEFRSPDVAGESKGLGDISARAKFNFHQGKAIQLAASLEVRMPTGDEEQLLGVGRVMARPSLLAAASLGRFSPHANFGYTFGGSGIAFGVPGPVPDKQNPVLPGPYPGTYYRPDNYSQLFGDIDVEPSSEFTYTVGFDLSLHDRLTIAGDVIGRTLLDSAELRSLEFVSLPTPQGGPGGAQQTQPFLQAGNVNLSLLVVGFKLNFAQQWLVTVNLIAPLTDSGLKPGLTPVVGIERAF